MIFDHFVLMFHYVLNGIERVWGHSPRNYMLAYLAGDTPGTDIENTVKKFSKEYKYQLETMTDKPLLTMYMHKSFFNILFYDVPALYIKKSCVYYPCGLEAEWNFTTIH